MSVSVAEKNRAIHRFNFRVMGWALNLDHAYLGHKITPPTPHATGHAATQFLYRVVFLGLVPGRDETWAITTQVSLG